MKCFTHKENDTIAVCVGCGNFICSECDVLIKGKHYCKSCLSRRGAFLRGRTLKRAKEGKMLAGICAGIARYFDVDPGLVRVIFVILGITTGIVPFLLIYGILMLVMPQE